MGHSNSSGPVVPPNPAAVQSGNPAALPNSSNPPHSGGTLHPSAICNSAAAAITAAMYTQLNAELNPAAPYTTATEIDPKTG